MGITPNEIVDGLPAWSKPEIDIGLFPYQEADAKWLSSRCYALLASEPGTGKTPIAIRACDLIGAERILILCPAIARMNWWREWTKFSPRAGLFSVLLTSNGTWPITTGIICSYDLATRPRVATWLASVNWEVMILDESHYLKDRKAIRTRLCLGGLTAHYRWALSGTPARNHAGDLYPVLVGFRRYAGDYWSFIRRYCKTVETPFGVKIVGSKNVEELKTLMAPILLRRRKDEVLTQLPALLVTDVSVEGTPPPMTTMERALFKAATDEDSFLFAMEQCKTNRRLCGLAKVWPVADIVIEELEADHYEKIVLFAWHVDVVRVLAKAFEPFHPIVLYGETPAKERDGLIEAFQTKPDVRVAVCNITTAGTAITLTAASEVGFVEASYVPSDNAQAAMRVHRIGQTKPVRVRFFNLADSVDEQVQKILRRKTHDLVQIFDDGQPKDNPFH